MKNEENGGEGAGETARSQGATGRETWTIQPEADVASLMRKAINEAVREAGARGLKAGRRGLRTRLLNEAVRAHYERLRGKREGEGKAESGK